MCTCVITHTETNEKKRETQEVPAECLYAVASCKKKKNVLTPFIFKMSSLSSRASIITKGTKKNKKL